MSMTKRHLESLPQAEQDAILGRPEEWTDDAGNEPEVDEDGLEVEYEDEDEESDKFTERDESPMVKPTGPCVTLEDNSGVEWKL